MTLRSFTGAVLCLALARYGAPDWLALVILIAVTFISPSDDAPKAPQSSLPETLKSGV